MNAYIKTVVAVIGLVMLSSFCGGSDFCDGFEEGFDAGYKEEAGYTATVPAAPACPTPRVDCTSGYQCGYNLGFTKGTKKAKEDATKK